MLHVIKVVIVSISTEHNTRKTDPPQIDGLFPNVLHILGKKNSFNIKPGYYRVFLVMVTMYYRLVTTRKR